MFFCVKCFFIITEYWFPCFNPTILCKRLSSINKRWFDFILKSKFTRVFCYRFTRKNKHEKQVLLSFLSNYHDANTADWCWPISLVLCPLSLICHNCTTLPKLAAIMRLQPSWPGFAILAFRAMRSTTDSRYGLIQAWFQPIDSFNLNVYIDIIRN